MKPNHAVKSIELQINPSTRWHKEICNKEAADGKTQIFEHANECVKNLVS